MLTPWTTILDTCLEGKESKSFLPLGTVGDFTDGFEVVVPEGFTMQQVQRLFKDYGLDAKPPKVRRKKGHCWVQLASGPYDLENNISILMKVCEGLR